MSLDVFKEFPDDARLWIYAFDNPLSREQSRLVCDRLASFLEEWRSHSVDVEGAFTIVDDRFVILSGASRDGISGCSIDRSVENFKYFRDELDLDALNRNLIHYRDTDGAIQVRDRVAFKTELAAGRCGPETIVFDLAVQNLGDLRAGRFEIPLAESWYARAFLTT